jgi:hypothetical protein
MGNFGRALPRFLIAFLALILALQGLASHSSISSEIHNSNSNPGYQNNSWFFLGPGWSIGSGGSNDYGNSGGGGSWFDSGGWGSGGGDGGSWGGSGGSDSGSW